MLEHERIECTITTDDLIAKLRRTHPHILHAFARAMESVGFDPAAGTSRMLCDELAGFINALLREAYKDGRQRGIEKRELTDVR